ncbi:MAG: alpha-2-macroglobulin family protein [Rhodospirillaceae bacterium]|nr:MAG: alpha-2-macroglobulin family protein [Rhodospirillaceae bacterium]
MIVFVRVLVLLCCCIFSFAARATDLSAFEGAAGEYRDAIVSERQPDGERDPQKLLASLSASMDQENWTAVADTARRLINLGEYSYEIWESLAVANEHLGKDLDSAYAAMIASQQAVTPQQRGSQLLRVARNLEKADHDAEALTAYEQAAALSADPEASDGLRRLSERLAFHIVGNSTAGGGDRARACVEFDRSLRSPTQLRYEDYVRVTPEAPLSFQVQGDTLCIDGLAYSQSYQISILKGLPASISGQIDSDQKIDLSIGDREPSVGFRNQAYVLPRVGSTGVPLYTVNVDRVKLKLLRINDRNLVETLNERRFLTNLYEYDGRRIADESGEEVWRGSMDIAMEKNTRQATSVPISDLVSKPQPGIYVLMARPYRGGEEDEQDQDGQSYWDAYATQWLVVSDLGLTTFSGGDGLSVFVRSLADATPIDRVEVRLLARNNEILAKTETDRSGFAHFDPGLLRGEGGRTATAVMALRTKDSDFSFLDLTRAAYDLSDRGVSGRTAPSDADVFFYTDRGVYRPGETVHLSALLRDSTAKAITGLPISLRLLRPDGVEARRYENLKDKMGGFQQDMEIADTARTGSWTVEAYIDPKGQPVATTTFLVEDVVPARIEVDSKPESDALTPGQNSAIDVTAKFLYGAPAADLVTKADILVGRDPKPFPAYPGYQFGLADEEVEAKRIALADQQTDAGGHIRLPIQLADLPDVQSPLAANLRVEVYEFGGRPVIESVSLPIRRDGMTLGIKPGFADNEAAEGSTAGFEVIALDKDGKTIAKPDLQYRLVKENWDYNWYFTNGSWDYAVTVSDGSVTTGSVTVPADKPGTVEEAVDWGNYRLEVFDPASGSAASVRFHAGWSAKPGTAETPDKLTLTADKPAYQPGETAEVMIRPPFDGEVLLTIATDRVIEKRIVTVPKEGKSVRLPVNGEWGAGAYVLASAFRPGEKAERGPGRAIGVTWLGIDPKPRQLQISMTVPDKILPRQHIELPITIGNISGGTAMLTLAAVDEGILQLTDFATPDPVTFYLGKRRLGLEVRDLYGQLIDGKVGRRGQIREGGDGDMRQRGAPPEIKLVALFSGPVTVDKDGKAVIGLDIPDYNGRLRLMAVAYDERNIGSAEAGLVVRDPIVAEISTPRFLAPGDQSALSLSLQNLDGAAGQYSVTLHAENDVQLAADGASFTTDLAKGATTSRRIAMLGNRVGSGEITLTINGPDGYHLERKVSVPVRPAQPPITESRVATLKPGERLDVPAAALDGFLPGTGLIRTSFSTTPNLDVQTVLQSLEHYPYGCLEQTTSIAFPLLFTSEVAKAWGLENRYEKIDADQVQRAIARVIDRQRFDGQFSLWSSSGPAEPWLSAYAMDFLTRARAKGFRVPDSAYANGLNGLRQIVRQDIGDAWQRYTVSMPSKAYALYVLTAAKQANLSDLRYVFDTYKDSAPILPITQLSAALAVTGDQGRAIEGFKIALGQIGKRSDVWWDYGSPLRDLAAIISLLTESGMANQMPADQQPAALLDRLAALQNGRKYLSTQEEAWLLLAASMASSGPQQVDLKIGDAETVQQDRPYTRLLNADNLQQGFAVANAGQGVIYARATSTGILQKDQPASSNGYSIERGYFLPDGTPADLAHLKQNDLLIVVIKGQVTDSANHQSMVIDLLPAGLEIENARLADRRQTAEYAWLPSLSTPDYEEYRDDRYVAAFDMADTDHSSTNDRGFTFAYLTRVVSPGKYKVPPVAVEDMYKPEFRAQGTVGRMEIMAP